MEEISNEDLKNVEGGSSGYGNIQFECVCGKKYLTEKNMMEHFQQLKHKSATCYYQQTKGKSSRGNKIGTVTATFSKGVLQYITYPNKKKVNVMGADANWKAIDWLE